MTPPVERYIGADIVAEIVHRNRASYGAEFTRADLCPDPLPEVDFGCAAIVWCASRTN